MDNNPVVALTPSFEAFHIQNKNRKRVRRDSQKARDAAALIASVDNHQKTANGGNFKHYNKFGDRKSRSHKSGLPKKGGAGGKGTWGQPGCELIPSYMDDHDPNYDSEEFDEWTFKTFKPVWTDDQVEDTVTPILKDYMQSGDLVDVLVELNGINVEGKKHLVVIYLITIALEMKNEFRELASILMKTFVFPSHSLDLSKYEGKTYKMLKQPFLTSNDVEQGLLSCCEYLSELILDTPNAPKVVGKFIARAIHDKACGENLIEKVEELECEHALECGIVASSLLQDDDVSKVKRVWGEVGGKLPLEILKTKMRDLLQDYVQSGDSEATMKQIKQWEVPHFNHEIVYDAVLMSIRDVTDKTTTLLVHLLKRFADTNVVTSTQMTEGFMRVYSEMPEINIRIPNSYVYLERLVNKCFDLKVIDNKLKVKAPVRSRKRFVSEGDSVRMRNSRLTLKFQDPFADL